MNDARLARHLRFVERVTNVLSVAVPAWIIGMGVLAYVQRSYWPALFNFGLAAFNIGTTIWIQRRIERRRRRFETEMRVLERLMRERMTDDA